MKSFTVEQELTSLCEDSKRKVISDFDISLGKHYEALMKNKLTHLLPEGYQENVTSFTITPTENPYESQSSSQKLKDALDFVEKFKEKYAFQTSEADPDEVGSKVKPKPQDSSKFKQQYPRFIH